MLYEKQNVKDRFEICIDVSIYIFWGVLEVFVKAIVENQMIFPQMVMYPHLLQGPIAVCASVGYILGGLHTTPSSRLEFNPSKI